MRVDGGIMTADMRTVPERIVELEEQGFDGAISAEMSTDPFFPLLLAAEHSKRIELLTSIAVAFARSPMTLANVAHDLNEYSNGRFILGLGSQIKPHIERRFSMPWSKPAARMREFIQAMRSIWDCWYDGKPLNFQGEFYSHTLMTPMFTPTGMQAGQPRVFLAAVGPLMTEVAGEVADGVIAHAFTTERYMKEVTLPAIARGLEKSGRSRADFEVNCPVFVISGDTEEAMQEARQGVSRQIAFYASTPAYRPVLELHGWGDLGPELTTMSKRGEWAKMGTLIDESMLNEFAIVAEPQDVASKLLARYGGKIDRLACTFGFSEKSQREATLRELQEA